MRIEAFLETVQHILVTIIQITFLALGLVQDPMVSDYLTRTADSHVT
jgi:hypothetical protein